MQNTPRWLNVMSSDFARIGCSPWWLRWRQHWRPGWDSSFQTSSWSRSSCLWPERCTHQSPAAKQRQQSDGGKRAVDHERWDAGSRSRGGVSLSLCWTGSDGRTCGRARWSPLCTVTGARSRRRSSAQSRRETWVIKGRVGSVAKEGKESVATSGVSRGRGSIRGRRGERPDFTDVGLRVAVVYQFKMPWNSRLV